MRPSRVICRAVIVAMTSVFALPVVVAHAADFPDKPIKLMVGFRPGGGTDTLATVLAKEMEKVLGKPVVKESRAGAGGGKAAAALKTANADGYTLGMIVTSTVAFNPQFLPKKTPYRKGDFSYLAGVAYAQENFYTKTDKPFKTFQEMVEHAKTNELTYARVTPFDKLMIQYFNKKLGTKIRGVPTKGGSGALKNVLGGHTDMGFGAGTEKKALDKGDVVTLASLRDKRISYAPNAPTLLELGHPITFSNHFLLAAPKDLDAAVKAKIVDAINKAQMSKPFQDLLAKVPFEGEWVGPDRLAGMIDEAHKRNAALIEALK